MKENRLLHNMVEKIRSLRGAIKQIEVLKNDGVIELNGLTKMRITKGETTNDQFESAKMNIYENIFDLERRVMYMGGSDLL